MNRLLLLTLLSFCSAILAIAQPQAVDLGLSVKWASADLGSTDGTIPGDYFSWGSTTTSTAYTPLTYPPVLRTGKKKTYVKGSMMDDFSPKDCKDELLKMTIEDHRVLLKNFAREYYFIYKKLNSGNDAAQMILGKNWRMPTMDEWIELRDKCRATWEKAGKRLYLKVTGPNGNHIYLAAGGWKSCKDINHNDFTPKNWHANSCCSYWTSTLGTWEVNGEINLGEAYHVFIDNNRAKELVFEVEPTQFITRGYLIRPVYDDRTPQPNPQPNPAPQPQPQPRPVVVDKSLPTFAWGTLPQTTTQSSVKIVVGIKSKSRITATSVYVNGQQYRGIKAVVNDGADMKIEQTVNLSEGDNVIKVSATNTDGTATTERHVVRQTAKPAVVATSKRIALIIGNANYPSQALVNPQNDATDMAAKLKTLGFEVILLKDATKKQMEDAINTLGQRAANYDAAMFYYAGHGIQYKGANYLIPVNANLQSASDVEYECTDMGRVLAKLEESGCKMKIIALDACRNNPFERSWYRGSATTGLSAVNAPVGTFISYATSPGSVAADGQTRNSPYTSALLRTLDTPGLTIEKVFKQVAASVFNATNHQQTPWYSSSLFQGDFIFNEK